MIFLERHARSFLKLLQPLCIDLPTERTLVHPPFPSRLAAVIESHAS